MKQENDVKIVSVLTAAGVLIPAKYPFASPLKSFSSTPLLVIVAAVFAAVAENF